MKTHRIVFASDLPAVAEGGSRRPAERRHRHLAARLLLLRHRPQHSRPHLALRQVGEGRKWYALAESAFEQKFNLIW